MRVKRPVLASGAAIVALLVTGCAPAVSSTPNGAKARTIPAGSVLLSGSPGVPVVNATTGTLYVPIQCPTGACASSSNVVDVINAAKCNTEVVSDCRVVAKAAVGESPLAAAIDQSTDTVYVANGTGSVSVVDGARCNATVTSGCGKPVATVNVGGLPVDVVFNPMTRTVYVANPKGSVFVINGATCNAGTTQGCDQPVKSVTDSRGPAAIDIDVAKDTVYAVDNGSGNGDTVSVIDGATCNGTNSSGCGVASRIITVGSGASWDAVDQASHTVYVANFNDGTVSVVDGSRCNAAVTSGCASASPAVPTGAGTADVAVDDSLHTVFAINRNDDTLSAIDTSTCRGAVTSGCPKLAVRARAASNRAPGYNAFPQSVTLLPQSGTAYLVNVGGASLLSVMNVGRCNAVDTSGCRVETPAAPNQEFEASIDSATDTIYASNRNLPEIDVLNGATCDATHLAGCAAVAEIPMTAPMAATGAIDDATHTLYASNSSGTEVSVINTATCNATNTATCARHPSTIIIGGSPGSPVLNTTTHTLYLPFGPNADKIAVVNAAICNAEVSSGCGQTPAVVNVGEGTNALGLSVKTDTIYAPSVGVPFASGNAVSVINGATCDGTNHSGCGHIAATVKVGLGPYGVAVDDATDTVYVANNYDGDAPGTVSIINGATCNGSDTAGCNGDIPMVGVGRSPLLIAIDTVANIVYVSDFASAGVSVLDGSTCNAKVTTGCSKAGSEQSVGSQPFGLAVNQNSNTVYAMTFLVSGSLSIFGGRS